MATSKSNICPNAITSRNKDGSLTLEEFGNAVESMRKQFPFTQQHLGKMVTMFHEYDVDKSGTIEMDEMRQMLSDIDKKMTQLPAVGCFFLKKK